MLAPSFFLPMPPQVDILLAVYNGSAYIAEQLQSILDQTFQDTRLIIRDNASEDTTVNVIEAFQKRYPDKIVLVRGNKNLGAMGNFASLMDLAEAPYVLFSDADDVWLPTKIADTLRAMRANEERYGRDTPLLVHTDLCVVDRTLNVIDKSFWNYCQINQHRTALNQLLVQNVVTGCTMMINQPLLQIATPVPNAAIMHDWWIALVAAAFGHIDVVPTATLLYRQHGNNVVGAVKTSVLKSLMEASNRDKRAVSKHHLQRTLQQAAAFNARYTDKLNPEQRQVVSDYAALQTSSWGRKRYLIFKNRFFKHTFLRTLGLLTFI